MNTPLNDILDAYNKGTITKTERDALLNNLQYKGADNSHYYEVVDYIESLDPGEVIYKTRDEGDGFAYFLTANFYEVLLPLDSVVQISYGESQKCSENHVYYLWVLEDMECLVKRYDHMSHHIYNDAPFFVWVMLNNFEEVADELEPITYHKAMEILASWKRNYED